MQPAAVMEVAQAAGSMAAMLSRRSADNDIAPTVIQLKAARPNKVSA